MEAPTKVFRALRDSVEKNLILKHGFLLLLNPFIEKWKDLNEENLNEIIALIKHKLKIGSSRIIKILQKHIREHLKKSKKSHTEEIIETVKTKIKESTLEDSSVGKGREGKQKRKWTQSGSFIDFSDFSEENNFNQPDTGQSSSYAESEDTAKSELSEGMKPISNKKKKGKRTNSSISSKLNQSQSI